MEGKPSEVFLVKMYDSMGRMLPIVRVFRTQKGAEAYVQGFLPTVKYQQGAAACKTEIERAEVGD